MSRSLGILVLGVSALLWAGCRTTAPRPALTADDVQFYVETSAASARSWALAESHVPVQTASAPVLTTHDILGVHVVTLDLGPALVVDLSRGGATALARQVDTNGARLLLVSRGRALGLARIDAKTTPRQISMFVELPAQELTQWADSLDARLRAADRSDRE